MLMVLAGTPGDGGNGMDEDHGAGTREWLLIKGLNGVQNTEVNVKRWTGGFRTAVW